MSVASFQLGEVSQFIRGITFKPNDVVPLGEPDSVGCFRTKNVQVDLDLSDVWGIPRSFVKKDEKLAKEGDIILSTANSWNLVGKASWVPKLEWEATAGGFVSILRADPKRVFPRYLYHWIVTGRTQAALRSCARQTTNISNLSIVQAQELKIPLPPLEEQKRIAGVLDQADALRRLRTRALDKLNTLGQAIFHEMFGDLRYNPNDWPQTHALGEVADVASGITKGRKTKSNDLREVPYLAVANVQDRHLKLDVVKTIEASEDEIERFLLKKGDILLTEGGDPDKLGRGTLWNEEIPECIHQNHIFRVRVESEQVRPTFLSWQIGSDAGKAYFLKLAKQTTGIASINKTQLKGFPVLLPPLKLQLEFETRLCCLSEQAQRVEAAKKGIDGLFASLQHRAFRGEL